MDTRLLEAARQRVEKMGLTNVTLMHGNAGTPEEVAKLPDDTFDLVYSERGPNLNETFMPKLKREAYMVQELWQDPLGLHDIFGRDSLTFTPHDRHVTYKDSDMTVSYYAQELEMVPVSIKDYYYEEYFRDANHLAAYLSKAAMLSKWWLPTRPYEPGRDRTALELYARYNTTPKGIRMVCHRREFLFRRARVNYYPVDGVSS